MHAKSSDLRQLWPGRPVWRLSHTNSHAACTELLPGTVSKCGFLHGVCCVEDLHRGVPRNIRTADSGQAPDSLQAMLPAESNSTACWLLTCAALSAKVGGRATSWQASQDSAWPCKHATLSTALDLQRTCHGEDTDLLS